MSGPTTIAPSVDRTDPCSPSCKHPQCERATRPTLAESLARATPEELAEELERRAGDHSRIRFHSDAETMRAAGKRLRALSTEVKDVMGDFRRITEQLWKCNQETCGHSDAEDCLTAIVEATSPRLPDAPSAQERLRFNTSSPTVTKATTLAACVAVCEEIERDYKLRLSYVSLPQGPSRDAVEEPLKASVKAARWCRERIALLSDTSAGDVTSQQTAAENVTVTIPHALVERLREAEAGDWDGVGDIRRHICDRIVMQLGGKP